MAEEDPFPAAVVRVTKMAEDVMKSLEKADRLERLAALLFAFRYFTSAAGDPQQIREARKILAAHDRELAADEQAAVAAMTTRH